MPNDCSDIVIHIDEDLSDEQIHALERDLAWMDGVYCACVHERTRHLMLVDFDPKGVRPEQMLREIQAHGMHAELIGL